MQRDPQLDDVNLTSQKALITPDELRDAFPLSPAARETVMTGRQTIRRILDREDPRLFVVVGPCSIHDTRAALDYARRLKLLADEVSDTLVLVMRVYFEKPRTTVGWKGLINDPDMDDSFQIEEGLKIGRNLLLVLNEMGLPCATEALDPIVPQYLSDLIAWSAIGARTTESQTHREMASGLSMPVGIKNGTDGGREIAINALLSVAKPHAFLGIDGRGQCAVIHTSGNRYGHMVLRGGATPNYDSVHIALTGQDLANAGLAQNVVVDCSHGNSDKNPALQPLVFVDCVHQVREGNRSIVGLMLESNLEWGSQKLGTDPGKLRYGVSVTDACIDFKTTEAVLRQAREKLLPVMAQRMGA